MQVQVTSFGNTFDFTFCAEYDLQYVVSSLALSFADASNGHRALHRQGRRGFRGCQTHGSKERIFVQDQYSVQGQVYAETRPCSKGSYQNRARISGRASCRGNRGGHPARGRSPTVRVRGAFLAHNVPKESKHKQQMHQEETTHKVPKPFSYPSNVCGVGQAKDEQRKSETPANKAISLSNEVKREPKQTATSFPSAEALPILPKFRTTTTATAPASNQCGVSARGGAPRGNAVEQICQEIRQTSCSDSRSSSKGTRGHNEQYWHLSECNERALEGEPQRLEKDIQATEKAEGTAGDDPNQGTNPLQVLQRSEGVPKGGLPIFPPIMDFPPQDTVQSFALTDTELDEWFPEDMGDTWLSEKDSPFDPSTCFCTRPSSASDKGREEHETHSTQGHEVCVNDTTTNNSPSPISNSGEGDVSNDITHTFDEFTSSEPSVYSLTIEQAKYFLLILTGFQIQEEPSPKMLALLVQVYAVFSSCARNCRNPSSKYKYIAGADLFENLTAMTMNKGFMSILRRRSARADGLS